jgi:hypothetical protein
VKHYGASSPIWPTRTEKGKAHQLVWPQEVVKKTYHSNHASSALQFVNNCLSVKANDKSSQGSSFSGFGASSFPGKDFEIHDSSIGKTAPVYDKSFSPSVKIN